MAQSPKRVQDRQAIHNSPFRLTGSAFGQQLGQKGALLTQGVPLAATPPSCGVSPAIRYHETTGLSMELAKPPEIHFASRNREANVLFRFFYRVVCQTSVAAAAQTQRAHGVIISSAIKNIYLMEGTKCSHKKVSEQVGTVLLQLLHTQHRQFLSRLGSVPSTPGSTDHWVRKDTKQGKILGEKPQNLVPLSLCYGILCAVSSS